MWSTEQLSTIHADVRSVYKSSPEFELPEAKDLQVCSVKCTWPRSTLL
jgi:hypothetical protein